MKRVLHISKFYHPYYGGIEDVVRTIVKELKPYYEQQVVCFNHERGDILEVVDDINIYRIETLFNAGSQPLSVSYGWRLQKLINSFKPDIIHLHHPNPWAALCLGACNIHGAKLILHWHADILGQRYLYPLYKPFEHALLKRVDRVIATSDMYMKASLPLRSFHNKISILPNVINEDKLKYSANEEAAVKLVREKYHNKKIVFFVGRHVEYKGIAYLIEAERYIKEDCVVLIAGVGEQTAYLKNLAAGRERIRFIGRLSDEELKYHLYASDVFAFPSVDRREAFGVALAEALYCGLPAVSFEVKGSGALWINQNGKTGFIVENRNSREFAKAISKILSSDELRNNMSVAAREWICGNFMQEQIEPIMRQIYS